MPTVIHNYNSISYVKSFCELELFLTRLRDPMPMDCRGWPKLKKRQYSAGRTPEGSEARSWSRDDQGQPKDGMIG
jgi:hypothetical protein